MNMLQYYDNFMDFKAMEVTKRSFIFISYVDHFSHCLQNMYTTPVFYIIQTFLLKFSTDINMKIR